MTINQKTFTVSHVLTFTEGVLSGGYIEDCDVFEDDYGYIIGTSELRRTEIANKYLGALAAMLDLVYAEPLTPPVGSIVSAPDAPAVAPEPLPEATPIVKVDDLNGQFTPQTGNIQPTVLGVPEPVQVEIVHTADDVEGNIDHAKIDDFGTVIAKDLLSAPLVAPVEPVPTKVPEVSPEVIAPVETSIDVTPKPEVTPVVTEVSSVKEDAKPEPVAAPANPSPDPSAPATSTSQSIITDSPKEHTSSLPVIDPGLVSPVVDTPVATPVISIVPAVVDAPVVKPVAPIVDAVVKPENLNDSDNTLALETLK